MYKILFRWQCGTTDDWHGALRAEERAIRNMELRNMAIGGTIYDLMFIKNVNILVEPCTAIYFVARNCIGFEKNPSVRK